MINLIKTYVSKTTTLTFLCALCILANVSLASDDLPLFRTVRSTGMGKTPEDAKKDALSNAVQEVVGTILDSSTLLINGQIISDTLLTLSNGYVKNYSVIETKTREGLFYITISADVKRDELKKKLDELNIKKVDGQSLAGEAFTAAKAMKQASEMLNSLFETSFADCFTVTAKKPIIGEFESNVYEVAVPVSVAFNMENYKIFHRKIRFILKSLARKVTPHTFSSRDLRTIGRESMATPNYPEYQLLWYSNFTVEGGVDLFTFHKFSFHEEIYKMDVYRARFLNQLNSFTVVLYDEMCTNKEKVAWTAYELDLKYLPIFQKIRQNVPRIYLNLKASDRFIVEKELSGSFPKSENSAIIGVSTGYAYKNYPSLTLSAFQPGILEHDFREEGDDCTRVFPLAPFFVYGLPSNGTSAYSSELRFLSVFHLTEQQISNIVSIEGKVVPRVTKSPENKFSGDSDIEKSNILQAIHRQERTMRTPDPTGSR